MYKQKLLSSLLTLLFLSVSPSCNKEKVQQIPYVAVDFYIDINSTFYNELTTVGGWVYVTGGYKGIIIYRLSMDEFVAYDRCCSYDPYNPCERVYVETNGLTMRDSCCGSRFQIIDGSPVSGPAKKLLMQYSTNFDGQYLHVYN